MASIGHVKTGLREALAGVNVYLALVQICMICLLVRRLERPLSHKA